MAGRVLVGTAIVLMLSGVSAAQSASLTTEEKIERLQRNMQDMQRNMQQEIKALKEQLDQEKSTAQQQREEVAEQAATAREQLREQTFSLLDRVKIGGYGSLRYEENGLDQLENTFTFRRFVLTTEAKIAPRLRFNLELEFERFRKLELERETSREEGGLRVQQAIEGTNKSEISLEQAWLEYDLMDSISLRAGAVLVPLGRFNIRHDDNLWNLPRRSLVDRGVSVIPIPAAWDELGLGLVGKIPVGSEGSLDYQFYVVNGLSLDAEVEDIIQTRDPRRSKLEAEVEFGPSTGTFADDPKEAKSLTGRLAFSPALGHELAGSFYWGRYTPQFMDDEKVWSLGFDGMSHIGGLELEWEYIFTRYQGLRNVARNFAQIVKHQAIEVEDEFSPDLETEIAFELQNLSRTKHGYWLELRYPFWPESLRDSFLARAFTDPQLIPIVRWEQVWLPSLLQTAEFENGVLTEFNTQNRFIHRVTGGLAYRPTPLVAFTLAYEYTWTNGNKSLADVTNFLPARANESDAHALMLGMTFGF